MKTPTWKYICFSLVSLLVIFFLFARIESPFIRKWDEARNAINALEMFYNGFDLVTTCHYQPEHWNTKPPLLIWIQYFSFKIFGIREFSVRFISALSGIALIPLLFFLRKKLKLSIYTISIALVIFITLPLVLKNHAFKTGDYDALLTVLMVVYSLCYFIYINCRSKQHLFYFFIFLFLATMTKGIAGLLFIPGLFLYTFSQNKLLKTLKNKNVLIGIITVSLLILTFYFLRERIDPGYINLVLENELGGRFLAINENHSENWYFYLKMLISYEYFSIYTPIIFAIPVYLYYNIKNKLFLFLSIIICSHIIIISLSQTKLYWYILPNAPLIALMLSIMIYEINKKLHFPLYLLIIFTFPIYQQIKSVTNANNFKAFPFHYYNSKFIKNNSEYLLTFDKLHVIEKDYAEHTRFYYEQLNYKKKHFIETKKLEDLQTNDFAILSDSTLISNLNKQFTHEIIRSDNNTRLVKIISKK